MRIFGLVLALGLGGCGITAQQRADIIDAAGEAAGARIEKTLRDALDARVKAEIEKARAGGATAEQLQALEARLRAEAEAGIALARDEATRRARELADRATPPPSEDGGWLGKLLAIGIQALLMSLAGGKRS